MAVVSKYCEIIGSNFQIEVDFRY